MLPSDLLIHRYQGDSIVPKFLAPTPANQQLAQTVLDCFAQVQGAPKADLDQALQELEGDQTDYRIKRGLAHLLTKHFCTFETLSPLDPIELRALVFAEAVADLGGDGLRPAPSVAKTALTLERVAQHLTERLGQPIEPEHVRAGLYADLSHNQRLTHFDPPTPNTLLHRYNLSQVQGIFYRAQCVIIHADRNDPGEYKLLFRYIKLFQLMAYVEGDPAQGFTLTLDGPTSLFKANTRYGLALAKLLPALLHVTRWRMLTQLTPPSWSGDRYPEGSMLTYTLDSQTSLVSHYPPGKPYDSQLEESFVERWQTTKTEWRLEREVELIPIPGSVMIPDFRLVHPDGRTVLLEIVGYWRPEYLRKKFAQVRKAERQDLILAISERLNLEKAGVNVKEIAVPVIWFKQKLTPKAVLEVLATVPPVVQ
jgi:predicted nuclease of restriction endonuclease-like RecB superfamily